MFRFRFPISLISIGLGLLVSSITLHAQWENLNPGAGGQIQDVVPDPHQSGRLIYCSDVDGAYLTEDDGATWEYCTWDTASSNILTAAFDPEDPQRVYLGMHSGLAISDDGGRSWTNAFGSAIMADPIMAIVVDSRDTSVVYAAPSNRNRWQDKEGRHGQRGIWVSRDRGQSWDYVIYQRKAGPRDVYAISAIPGTTGGVVLAGQDGLYRSEDAGKTWARVRSPARNNAVCWGTAVSPDGRWLYASYERKAGDIGLFAVDVDQLGQRSAWVELFASGQGPEAGTYWIPRLDPMSTPDRHVLLTAAFDNAPFGLVEITVNFDGGEVAEVDWRQLMSWEGGRYGLGVDPSNRYTDDVGWEQYYTRPLTWHWTPESWGPERHGIWSTKDQTVYFADLTDPDFPFNWDQRFCDFVEERDGVRTYRTRGANCTVIFDSVARGDYAIMCNADNGVTESWDGGNSWSVVTRPMGNMGSRSNSALIVEAKGKSYALAHVATGWGAASYNGRLFAKPLERHSPTVAWQEIAGGDEEVAGLPNHKYSMMVSDSHRPERVYVAAATKILSYNPWRTIPGAVYVCEDIVALIEKGEGGFERVGSKGQPGPTFPEDQNRGLFVDPHDANTLYVGGEKVVWKATRPAPDAEWTWSPVVKGRWVAVWSQGGATSVAVSKDDSIYWASDVAAGNWAKIFRRDDALRLRQPAWYEQPELQVNAMVPDGKAKLYFTLNTLPGKHINRSLGIFCLDLSTPGQASLADLSGDLPLKRLMNARITKVKAQDFLYASTWGNGLWRLALD